MHEPIPGDGPRGGNPDSAVTAARLVEDHLDAVYRYAYRLSGNRDQAEELTQQAFLQACARIGQLRRAGRARAWLLAIVRNCYWRQLRQRQREPQLVPEELCDQWCQAPSEEADWDAEQLQQALDRLPAVYRVVLLMHYFEQASYQQIARRLDIPVGTVMSRLSRAKARLRRLLSREGHAVAPAASSAPID